MNNPIYIAMPMPIIVLQIPSIKIICSREFLNEYHSGSDNWCTHCGRRQSEDEVDEDNMKKEEVEVEEIKVEEIKQDLKKKK